MTSLRKKLDRAIILPQLKLYFNIHLKNAMINIQKMHSCVRWLFEHTLK